MSDEGVTGEDYKYIYILRMLLDLDTDNPGGPGQSQTEGGCLGLEESDSELVTRPFREQPASHSGGRNSC